MRRSSLGPRLPHRKPNGTSTATTPHRGRRRLGVGKPEAPPTPGTPERGLMCAVLIDAVRCLAGNTGSQRNRVHLAAQARRWVAAVDAIWPYSFENICLALDLDPRQVRTRLLSSAHTVRSVLERLEKHLLAS